MECRGQSEKSLDRMIEGIQCVLLHNCERWFRSGQIQHNNLLSINEESDVILDLSHDLGLS